MTLEEQTQPAYSHPFDPVLFKLKLAFFVGVCGGNRERYLAIKGRLLRAAARVGLYERGNLNALTRFVSSGDTVLDIGANAGVYSLALAALAGPSGVVVAFEPLSFLVPELTRCTGHLPSVRIHTAAVGSRVQEGVQIRIPLLFGKIPEPALATLQEYAYESEILTVPVTTVDQCRAGCQRISFIKMDVEGHELEVLEGARSTLRNDRSIVQFESNPTSHTSALIDELAAQEGYLRAVLESGKLTPLCAGQATKERNHYLIPQERAELLR
jgi:FkbM family methyltransferase